MVFSSLVFLYVFLPVLFLLYFSFKHTGYRNWILIIASFLFYAWGEPVWVSLLAVSALIAYMSGLWIDKYRGTDRSKLILALSVSINLLMLIFFKYVGFLVDTVSDLLRMDIPYNDPGLPIGISFFTFQAISYLIDVYRGDLEAKRSPVKLLLYLSLFPQLIAGPIVRYTDIEKEIDNRRVTLFGFNEGITRFLIGLGKKVIFANMVGEGATLFLDGDLGELSVMGAWLGITLFALQIYFDFSGYCDMAIGLGKMFGFTFPENFKYPYISLSASDFWRRWNLTLGSFFRDYVYIPLGGNRRFYIRNLFVVWFLTGLWHGASWNFIFWGLYFGVLIYVERMFLLRLLNKLPRIVSHAYLVLMMLLGWVLFYFTDLERAIDFFQTLFGLGTGGLYNLEAWLYIKDNLYLIAAAAIGSTPIARVAVSWLFKRTAQGSAVRNLVVSAFNLLILVVCTALLVGSTYNPFLYFRF
ncbi:MBOAT family O-acyltransferase [Marinicrinis lubricantis]|uniref:MBOAT family O-acyltransferase n=1 Tax=Marinicrinis lubricantis TaxID=2086470 RepID=A0ABW1IJL8_9BACL